MASKRVGLALAALVFVVSACAVEFADEARDDTPPRLEAGPTPAVPAEGWPTAPPEATRARVVRIVDGDTVVVAGIDVGSIDRQTGGRRVRIIGVDTPEVHGRTECFGREASAFARSVLDGTEVLVDFDVQPTDRYGRALAYLWDARDGVMFNARLVWEGYATTMTIPPNVRYAEFFRDLAAEAREADRGLWAAC